MKKVIFREKNDFLSEEKARNSEEKHSEKLEFMFLFGRLYETSQKEGKLHIYV